MKMIDKVWLKRTHITMTRYCMQLNVALFNQ
ncbi:Uncharacterised protein [Serratia liquefaciens]|jgi:hypothetical protein|nr:hypothetical protein M495_11015 [Serratia liquefaciens ATCC 27592]CAB1215568.1 hypothetical protein SFB10_2104 [Serratia liquefaciens]CAI0738201.1 Uncharacterised protein [Serratia liquefaciens]CAI0745947.1 Uncharacterised protein [Serratia liquefaciens]CAI0834338.1 Uncharacterised protein [Serratia liquefaciens]